MMNKNRRFMSQLLQLTAWPGFDQLSPAEQDQLISESAALRKVLAERLRDWRRRRRAAGLPAHVGVTPEAAAGLRDILEHVRRAILHPTEGPSQ